MADGTSSNVQLPEEAIHSILSSLPSADAIRASATSRQWRLAWVSSPFLSFDEKSCPFKNSDFFDYVDRSIALWLRRSDHRITIERLSLSAAISDDDTAFRLHRIISFAKTRKVKAIELLNDADDFWTFLHIDPLWPLLFACDSLDALSLRCFGFCFPNSPPATTSPTKKLVFDCNLVDDASFKNFLACFPFLEDLTFGHCLGLQEIDISSSSLKTLELFLSEHNAESVVINAESLRSFSYRRGFRAAGIVRFLDCISLKSLWLDGIRFDPEIGTKQIQDIVSQIMVLEDLTLECCQFTGVFQISHRYIKRLNLKRSFGIKKAEIYTPNLRFFKYFGFVFHFSAFQYDACGLFEAHIGLCTGSFGTTEWFWFVKLRNFVENFKKCNWLALDCSVSGFPEELRVHDYRPDSFDERMHLTITNLELEIEDYVHFIGAMVEIFPCVETLTLKTSFAIISIKFDESGIVSPEWCPTVWVENEDNYATILQSINDAVRKILEFLGWKDVRIVMSSPGDFSSTAMCQPAEMSTYAHDSPAMLPPTIAEDNS